MLDAGGAGGNYSGKKKPAPVPAATAILGASAPKGPVPARKTSSGNGATASAGATQRLAAPVTANQYTYNGLTSNATAADVGAASGAPAAPAAPAMSQADYLAGDSTYQSALASLKKTMAGYQADHDTNLTKYDTDYNEGLTNLGWNGKGWNQDDTNTAYGRSYNNQLNDFGARDMLQSSFYGDSLNDMVRQFNDQKGDIDKARTNYRDDQDSTLGAEKNQTQTAQQQALAEAIARMAAGVSAS